MEASRSARSVTSAARPTDTAFAEMIASASFGSSADRREAGATQCIGARQALAVELGPAQSR